MKLQRKERAGEGVIRGRSALLFACVRGQAAAAAEAGGGERARTGSAAPESDPGSQARRPREAGRRAPGTVPARRGVAMSSVSPIQIPSRLPLLLHADEGVLLPGSTMRTSADSARNLQLVRSRLLKGTSLQSSSWASSPTRPARPATRRDLPPLHR